MSYHLFYRQLDQTARELFPSLKEAPSVSWDVLISPVEVRLPALVRQNCERAIRALYSVSRRPEYLNKLESVPGVSDHPTRHRSVLMAYDFHTDPDGNCSLVEVNTNAAGFMLASLMEMTHAQTKYADYKPLKDLRASFENELTLWSSGAKGAGSKPSVAIADEEIEQQKMYAEFLMYQDWFREGGWNAELCDSKAFTLNGSRLATGAGTEVDFVYNRMTDFYLENPEHATLREAFVKDAACFSPNPREYWAIADKQRLIQFGQPGFLDECGASAEEKEAIEKVLIPTYDKTSFSSFDEIWSQRKSLFFKPKRSHGGKSVYRGESVSRKVFERLMSEDILIQRFRPAQHVPTDDPRSVLSNWKFDLRFYVYEDRIQLTAARIYQGQVTNFSSPMGGFTLVRF
jgi:hypothetical protein